MSSPINLGGPIVVGRLAAAPSNPTNGMIYFDTTLGKFQQYRGGSFKDLPSTAEVQSLIDDAVAEIDNSALQAEIDAAELRLDAVEADIVSLEAADTALDGRLDTAESNISALQAADTSLDSRLDTVESDISDLEAADVTLQSNIDAEETRALAAEAALQTSINSIISGLTWRPSMIAATSDADLASAANDTALSTLLPFSDDESPAMVIGDFAAGQHIVSKNGATSKIFRIYDDAGTLKVTTAGVSALASGEAMVVRNDLPDSPASQEGLAIYFFNGSDLLKIGDFDWSLATGIDLSGSFVSSTGTVVSGDSVEAAISKIVGNLAAEIARATAAENALDGRLDTAESDIDQLQLDVVAAQSAADDAQADATQALADAAAAQSDVDALDLRVDTAESDIDALQAADVSLDSRLDTAESEIDALQAADVSLDSRLDTAESEIDALQAADTALDGRLDIVEAALPNKLENVVEDTSPQLGGSLDLNSQVIMGDMKRSANADASNFITEKYIHSISLLASQTNTAIAALQFAHATFEGMEVVFKIKETTSNDIKIGTLRIVTNGTNISINEVSVETADTGITFSAAIVGANVEVRYSSGSNAATMRADVKQFKA